MMISLTNFGHRYITGELKSKPKEIVFADPLGKTLLRVLEKTAVNVLSIVPHIDLITNGLLQIDDCADIEKIQFRYTTNPLENISRVIFEFTTRCNFDCAHCRNGGKVGQTETDIEKLKEISDILGMIDIQRFDFIGGEVTKYGNGWLELAAHINRNKNKMVSIITNGWWVGQKNFEAAGKSYADDKFYLADLADNGVTHIIFSIDGNAQQHDKSRKNGGLFNRVIGIIPTVKDYGIEPRISALINGKVSQETLDALAEISGMIYDFDTEAAISPKLEKLFLDSSNYFSNFIDIGNGAGLRQKRFSIEDLPPELLRCKAFYRPSPNLRINASGNVSVCPLLDCDNDYGNIHEMGIIEILNNFQNAKSYQLHADNQIADYLRFFDKEVFGSHFDHVCSIRTILSLIAREIDKEDELTEEKIKTINQKVAKATGFVKSGVETTDN